MLNDPIKRKHLGPCCVSKDGMLRGEKKFAAVPSLSHSARRGSFRIRLPVGLRICLRAITSPRLIHIASDRRYVLRVIWLGSCIGAWI